MDFKRLSQEVKRLVDKRGGTDSVKEDAAELRDIARGQGSMSDKAKEAADALKEPGAGHQPHAAEPAAPAADEHARHTP
jgi:hypothetical protein